MKNIAGAVSLFLLATSGAHAKRAATPVCAPASGTTRLVVSAGTITACYTATIDDVTTEKCFALSATAAPKLVATLPTQSKAASPAEVRTDRGTLSVCVGTKCKKLGKRLQKAIKTASLREEPVAPLASADGKAVVVGGSDAWNVAADRQLKLKRPKEYKIARGDDVPSQGVIEVVGGTMVASWFDCAGPCGWSVIVDSAGRNHGDRFGGAFMFEHTPGKLGVLSVESENMFRVIDAVTGKSETSVAIPMDGVAMAAAAKVDDATAVVTWEDSESWRVQLINVGTKGVPSKLGASYVIPSCKQ